MWGFSFMRSPRKEGNIEGELAKKEVVFLQEVK
jgi:hypothetical protein